MQQFSNRSDNPTEFDKIVAQVRGARINSGSSQAACVAASYGPMFGYDPADLLAAANRPGDGVRWG